MNNKPSKKLIKITQIMCACNTLKLKPVELWPPDIGFSYEELNLQAEYLPNEAIIEFVDGEAQATSSLVNIFSIHALHNFIEAVFNGPLSKKLTY